jgi:UTP--glucose-1-phosphate uridylyltransferase
MYSTSMLRAAPGFLAQLHSQLDAISPSLLEIVNRRGGLRTGDLLQALLQPVDHAVHMPTSPVEDLLPNYFDIPPEVTYLGAKSIKEGKTAYCILCGGAGTRFGGTKGLVRLAKSGKTLLQHKIEQMSEVADVWVMASPSNYEDVVSHIRTLPCAERVKVFLQFESLRLTPDNSLFFLDNMPSLYPCGHGDVIPALQESGILQDFVKRGGEHVVVVNVDNVLASPENSILGQHIAAKSPVSCEVVDKLPDEPGGVVCFTGGRLQVVEQFRMTPQTDMTQFTLLNTNTFIFDARLDFSNIQWSWHRVRRKLKDQFVIQYERLIQDLTENFDTQYIYVPRSTRFAPVKTQEDLQRAESLICETT